MAGRKPQHSTPPQPPKSKGRQIQSSKKSSGREIESFARVETGIAGLDRILDGGFLKGGTYLILGAPGTGKTIFANQLCFHQINKGKKAVYVTLLAESHTRMFGNLKPMHFFRPEYVTTGIQYISGYSVLEKEGLDGLLRLLRDLVYQHGAQILFIDGVASADELSGSTVQFKKFVHHLNSVLGITGCTTFLLSSAEGDQSQPEYTMVDGIVKLAFSYKGMKTAREIEVRKFRGSSHLYGRHFMEINENGLSVHPRIEAALGHEHVPRPLSGNRLSTGLKSLDQMLKGGVVPGTVTSLLGPVGTGKTQLGLEFLLEGARKGERGLYFSLYEHPARVQERLDRMGKRFSALMKKQLIRILRRDVGDHFIDKMMSTFLQELKENQIERVFIDGIAGFRSNMLEPDRLVQVLIAVCHEIRSFGATTYITEETDLISGKSEMVSRHSAIMDNVFEFQCVNLDSHLTQIFQIVKTRDSECDKTIREIVFTNSGIQLGSELEFKNPFFPTVQRKRKELQ